MIQKSEESLSVAHPSFRIISTASRSISLRDWLTYEHSNMFFPILGQPMDAEEESALLLATGCSPSVVSSLMTFATKYRESISAETTTKQRKLGTRALVRIARRIAQYPWSDDLHLLLSRALLAEFLPPVERMNLDLLLADAGVQRQTAYVSYFH